MSDSEPQFDDDSERVNQLRAEWLEHPVSRAELQRLKERARNLKVRLDEACESSADPEVRGVWREYRAVTGIFRSMEGKK